ncbi:DUF2493 domain-containing protein [Burkholderia sp. AU44665]|uniref:DUF2493 domain-containing protein n=1 Tax=Burkholderia sp. AU44665 TaxID=3059203 RepID=UPI00265F785F|nr:DUF2493 domain-containing protein [Burkholderia sp. AU44665]MDN7703296.1 DUF2493 domain-containing protein [Burkholderia sp. AU44665]
MKVIVCGGRDYEDADRLFSVLDEQHQKEPISLLIHGGAVGADMLAMKWAKWRKVDYLTVNADWSAHGRAAGPIRNAKMLSYKPDLVITFPGGRDTADMTRQALAAGVELMEA